MKNFTVTYEDGSTDTISGKECSDGYHTFDELYDHRNMLFIVLCVNAPSNSYWVEDHYPGWDLLVLGKELQMSYHVPAKFRELYRNKIRKTLSSLHKFDGHTPADVLERLKQLL